MSAPLVTLGAGANGESEAKQHAQADPVKGAEVFQMYCVPCHGHSGEGDGPMAASLTPPPKSFKAPDFLAGRDDAYLEEFVAQGGGPMHNRPMMPSWVSVLRHEDVVNVIAHIRSLAKK